MLIENFDEVLKRNIEFMSNPDKKGVLVKIGNLKDSEKFYIKPLEEWNFPDDYKEYSEQGLKGVKLKYEQRRGILDDTIPIACPYYGMAEHSAFVGGEVSYGANTSYHHHPIKNWDDMAKLSLDEKNQNFRLLLDSMEYIKEKSEKMGFVLSLRGVSAPMELANTLRGNDFFTDMYDEEENIRKLLEFCVEAGHWTIQHQKEIIGTMAGGVFTGMGLWLPNNGVGHVSEDTSTMCSPAMYEEFGKPYTEKFLEKYDGGVFHLHAMGKHIIPLVAQIEKARVLQITDDPNQPSPIEIYKEYADVLKDKITFISANEQEILDNIEFFENRKTIISLPNVENKEHAKRILDILEHLR
ncbi:MAG: uroporphyrinogen decarboxylase family protein [Clostridia bacterium]